MYQYTFYYYVIKLLFDYGKQKKTNSYNTNLYILYTVLFFAIAINLYGHICNYFLSIDTKVKIFLCLNKSTTTCLCLFKDL